MKRKSALFLSMLLIPVMLISSCSNNEQKNADVDKEIKSLNERYAVLDNQVKILDNQVKNLNDKLQEEVNTISSFNDTKNEIFPVYVMNIDSGKKETGLYITLSKDKTLEQKLGIIAEKLSKLYFSDLPIELAKIETVNNKKVAVIDLKESKENQGINDRSLYKGKSWAVGYFQGSTGGAATTMCLVETFLQKEYKDQWIDGIRFTYNGGSPDGFDHIPNLGTINYR